MHGFEYYSPSVFRVFIVNWKFFLLNVFATENRKSLAWFGFTLSNECRGCGIVEAMIEEGLTSFYEEIIL